MERLLSTDLLLSKSNIKHLIQTGDVAPLRGHVFDVRLNNLNNTTPFCRVRVFGEGSGLRKLTVSMFGKFKLFELDVAMTELSYVEDIPKVALTMNDLS